MSEKRPRNTLKNTNTLTAAMSSSCWTGVMVSALRGSSAYCLPGQGLGFLEGLGGPAPAALLAHVVLVLVPELLQGGLGRGDGRVPERAQGLAADRVADVPEDVQVALRALPYLDAVQQPEHPARPLPARRALAAGFVLVEVGQLAGHPDHAGRVVHDDRA